MSYARLFNLAFSNGGVLIALLFLSLGLLIRPRSRVLRAAMPGVVVVYTLLSIYPIPHALNLRWSAEFRPLDRRDVPAGRTAIALLGSGAYTAVDWRNGHVGVPDPIGLERTLEAARVYALIEPEWVISSGGLVDPESLDVTPGIAMKETLVRLGVPAAKVIVKDEARNTHDESMNVSRLVSELKIEHVVLVTSGIHMRRAMATFRAARLPVIPAPAREDKPGRLAWTVAYLPSQRGLYESSLLAHEVFGSLYYWYKGWR